MPLTLRGSVALRISGESGDSLQLGADEFAYEEGGMRVLGDECTQHEFLYKYAKDPRFELILTASAINGTVETVELTFNTKNDITLEIERNTLEVAFIHDPGQDDEPLTPVSSN